MDVYTLARFIKYVHINKETNCWEWTGALNTDGYGIFYYPGNSRLAHRVAYEHDIGPIASGMHVDHKCIVKHCVNPDHLQQVSNLENQLLAVERKENFSSAKTHCKRGHEFTEDNTRYYLKPHTNTVKRSCRACKKVHNERYRSRR